MNEQEMRILAYMETELPRANKRIDSVNFRQSFMSPQIDAIVSLYQGRKTFRYTSYIFLKDGRFVGYFLEDLKRNIARYTSSLEDALYLGDDDL